MNTLLAVKRIGFFVLLLVLSASWTSSQAARSDNCQQLFLAAQTHLTNRVNIIPNWRLASLAEPVAHYNLDGKLSACVFPVSKNNNDAGYIVVSALLPGNPVIEYSENPAIHKLAGESTRLFARETGIQINTSRPLYLGALSYYYEVCDGKNCANNTKAANTHRLIEMGKETIISVPKDNNSAEINLMKLAEEMTLTTLESNWGYVSGVPNNYNRNWSDGSCVLGCGPSAVGAVLKYWDDNGYPNLVSPGGEMTMLWDLHYNYLYTNCSGWSWIPYPSVTFGGQSVAYAANHGYNNFSHTHHACTSYDPTCYYAHVAAIDQQQPTVLTFVPWPFNQGVRGHVVAGVGYYYDELIVYDNAWGIGKDTFVPYGQNYLGMLFDVLHPPSP